MTEKLELQKKFVLEYLSEHGQNLWHAMADGWNWDNSLWILEWIAQQPDCTRATAQLIFWRGEPEWYLPTKGKEDWERRVSGSREVYELVKLIVSNWNSGFYTENTIEFVGPPNPIMEMASYRRAEAICDPSLLPWQLPESIGEGTYGKEVSCLDYDLTEGFPDELSALLIERFGEPLELSWED